jgi:transposase
MASAILPRRRDVGTVEFILGSAEIQALIDEIEADYICGRRGYGPRRLVAVTLCKFLYVEPSWAATVEIVRGNPRLMTVCGCADESAVPSPDAMYRFMAKLRQHPDWLESLIRRLQEGVRELRPTYGKKVAGDGTDLPAYANGQKYVNAGGEERKVFSDPDASWGHRGAVSTRKGGGFYGYKPHGIVCPDEELPVAWTTRTAKDAEIRQVEPLLDTAEARGFEIELGIFDKGYDVGPIYNLFHQRGKRVVIPLKDSEEGRDGYAVPECKHGRKTYRWVYAGTDLKRQASKWRCPLGKCKPKSVWLPLDRFHPAIPRQLFHLPDPNGKKDYAQNPRSKKTYGQRGAVERFWSRLKDEWGLKRGLRVRRLDRVAQHVDLTVIVYLAFGLARLRAAA